MARRKAVEQEVNVADLLLDLSKKLVKQSRKPNILGYRPHQKQMFFHKAIAKIRLYIGGNRSGKSYGAVAEDIWYASGTHPYKTIPDEQIRGRVVAVDLDRGVKEILIPIFKELCPDSFLRGGSWANAYQEKERILHFKYNDSYIEFMSYEQSVEKFAGTSRHFIHYDEEPPKDIFDECGARLIDTNGESWISMTPLLGMTWLYERLYQPAENADDKVIILEGDQNIGPVWDIPSMRLAIIEVGMNENPYISDEARIAFLAGLDPDDRTARSKGHFVQTAGKVFKSFEVTTHVTTEEFDPKEAQRKGWQIYTSTDHGWNAPTAWLWHAVAPTGAVLTFGEHYKSEMTIQEHAIVVKDKEKGWGLNSEDIIRTGDPAMHQHSGLTGGTIIDEYIKNGIYIYTDSVPKDPSIGIARMQQYFRIRSTGKPEWMLSSDCPNFIKELKNLHWKVFTSSKTRYTNNPQETVHKKNDHAFDSAKYFATFLSDLAPDAVALPEGQKDATMSYDESLRRSLRAAVEKPTEWQVVESYS